ncbi:hypothetical protein [Vallitalea guaymasensis]|uniref:hypothetical protein n=1 Tax=Vallitalea guaymasensis TaxID=1185412 RepID=UPI000DE1CF83|nr:hypothetical protein [Vallitalea guaymasensis]
MGEIKDKQMSNPNNVNESNFNETMKGYLKRAFEIAKMTEEEQKKIMNGIRWALSELTMEEARREYYKD